VCNDWETFIEKLNQKNVCLVPWCNETECEKAIKIKTKDESEDKKEKKKKEKKKKKGRKK